jgi:uncharacterized protein
MSTAKSAEKLHSSSPRSRCRILLAHGSGTPMTSPFLSDLAENLTIHDIAVTRFEFEYMSERRRGGSRRPPPRIERLVEEFSNAILEERDQMAAGQALLIGGKSMGGRVASMIADQHFNAGAVQGLVCLGYPFHPTGQPTKLRIDHLSNVACPTLIVQGTRDPFGNRDEILTLKLDPRIQLHWIGDGDHDFGPRGNSGFTRRGNILEAASAVARFAQSLDLN